LEGALLDAEFALAGTAPAVTLAEADASNVVPLQSGFFARPAVWAAGLAAIAACALFFVVRTPSEPVEYALAAPATADERVTLPDGSSVHLNRNASIHVTYGETRRIELERGEASFDVAHDERRPFEVAAGDALVRDIGTIFNIARNRASTVVTVREGEVEVRASSAEVVRVAAGYEARIALGAPVAVSAASGDAFAWQHGRLVYDDAPLGEVIEDLNRYSTTPIELAVNAQNQRFSGILILDTPQDMLARLEGFLPIRSVERDDRIVVESRP
jgi:transmembrane sensor